MNAQSPLTQIAFESVAAGVLNAWSFVCSLTGGFHPSALLLPSALLISTSLGIIGGLLFSPVMLLLRHLTFRTRAILYGSVVALTAIVVALNHPLLGIIVPAALLLSIALALRFFRRRHGAA